MDDNFPRYKAWETEASLFVSIDVLDHHTGVRHSALEGHTAVAARGLLVIVACALHQLAHISDDEGSTLDPATLEDLVESFSFSETKKKSMAANLCTVLCDTVSDKTTLPKVGGVILPLDRHTIFVTFAPTVDDTAKTALPRELRLALIHQKALLQGRPHPSIGMLDPGFTGINLSGCAPHPSFSIPDSQGAHANRTTRQGSDVLAWIAPHGHASWLPTLLRKTPEDSSRASAPLPDSSLHSQKGTPRSRGNQPAMSSL